MGHLSHHPFSTSLEEELWAPNCSGHSSSWLVALLCPICHNLLPQTSHERPSCQVSYIMSLPHSLSASQHTWNPTPHPYQGPLGSLWPWPAHKGSSLPSPLCTRHPAPCCSLSTWTTYDLFAVSISWPLLPEALPPLIPTWAHPPLTSFSSWSLITRLLPVHPIYKSTSITSYPFVLLFPHSI